MSTYTDILSQVDPEEMEEICADPIRWCETFLLTPESQEPFKANFVQRRIMGSTYRFNVIRVHRRSGKTFSMAALSLYYAAVFPHCRILVACPGRSQVDLIFGTIRSFIKESGWLSEAIGSDHKSPIQEIVFSSGASIRGFTTGASTRRKGMGLRGAGADVIIVDEGAYLADGDWQALTPIMRGDKYVIFPPKVYIASTPALNRGFYYEICTSPRRKFDPKTGAKIWNEIWVSITDNPDFTEQDVAEARALSNDVEWAAEWEAIFPDVGDGVFPKSLVDRSRKPFSYASNLKGAIESGGVVGAIPTRTIGVDWDKYNKDGHGPDISVLETQPSGNNRVVYRESIPQSQFSLTRATDRIIELNRIFQPVRIYIDRGYGDMQLETLQLYGKQHPDTKLTQRLAGIQFGQLVDVPMPNGRQESRRFKQVMVNLLRKWFEEGRLEISLDDQELYTQFLSYHIIGKTDQALKFSEENEHGIDSIGLASMAMWLDVQNPFAPEPATKVHQISLSGPGPGRPQALPWWERGEQYIIQQNDSWGHSGQAFSRSSLGRSGPGGRSSF